MTPSGETLPDTNVVLRYLLADVPDQFAEAKCVFRANPATIPTGKRPPFRQESGRHSDSIPSTIPEHSGQCDVRV